MMGHKTGVAKRIQDLQPRAYPTHCHGHSLSLSVKDTTKNCKLLSDIMDTAKEFVSLIKFSPKRENLLGTISLDEKLQSDIRGRIIGCQAQMNTFDFFFGLNLGQRLFSHTDNLSTLNYTLKLLT